MEVVQAIAALPRVKNNTNSPFFQYGKATGAATEPAKLQTWQCPSGVGNC
jgi:hypothetical protein